MQAFLKTTGPAFGAGSLELSAFGEPTTELRRPSGALTGLEGTESRAVECKRFRPTSTCYVCLLGARAVNQLGQQQFIKPRNCLANL